MYSSGCVVIAEDLSNGEQRHFVGEALIWNGIAVCQNGTRPCTYPSPGHVEEVSTLAVQHDGQVLASASPAFDSTPCEIRIWRTDTGKCSKVQIGSCYSNKSL